MEFTEEFYRVTVAQEVKQFGVGLGGGVLVCGVYCWVLWERGDE